MPINTNNKGGGNFFKLQNLNVEIVHFNSWIKALITFLMEVFLGYDSFLHCHGFQHFIYEFFMVHKVFLWVRKRQISKEGSYMLLSDVYTWIVVENWKGLDIHKEKNCTCSHWGVEKFWTWVSGNYAFNLKDSSISYFTGKLKLYRIVSWYFLKHALKLMNWFSLKGI